jgi:hypothetical protein
MTLAEPSKCGQRGNHDLQAHWGERSQARYTVSGKYRRNENRPFSRWVQWIETAPGAPPSPARELEFGNFSSPQHRAANQ